MNNRAEIGRFGEPFAGRLIIFVTYAPGNFGSATTKYWEDSLRKIAALTAVSALALVASPASAQAVSGPRVEILGGWDNVKADIDLSDFDTPGPEDELSDEALVYGIGAGYDFALSPSFSVGADVEATKSQTNLAVTDELFIENGPDTATVNDDQLLRTRFRSKGGRDLYVGGRATFHASDAIAFYLKAGYSWFRTKNSVYQTLFPAAAASGDLDLIGSDNETLGGWRVGAGMSFTNGIFYAGPEYRYSNYGDGVKRHQLVAVAGIKFGRRAEPLPPPVVEAPPPPPPPPATQTCPDGSVILATEVCPAPPPPPPPPPPAPERG